VRVLDYLHHLAQVWHIQGITLGQGLQTNLETSGDLDHLRLILLYQELRAFWALPKERP